MDKRVLSIQSHVVSGYVGNKSATFPMQVLGIDVDAINSVQFCNHTGYPSVQGDVIGGEQVLKIVDGLEANGLLAYTHILTGYIGSVSFLRAVVDIVKRIKKLNPDVVYVCDPVMGDNGKLYVPPDLVPIYREEVVPLADILTPNQFEVEQLTDCKISDVTTAREKIQNFHARGVSNVVLTSMSIDSDVDSILVVGSSQASQEQFVIKIPRLDESFTGTGDLFSALTLARSCEQNANLLKIVTETLSTTQAVLKRTHEHMKSLDCADVNSASHVSSKELRLIQSKQDIENPPQSNFETHVFDMKK